MLTSSLLLFNVLGGVSPTLSDSNMVRPNIILILTDDMGWSDLGCYGSKHNQTPHIDKMAQEGIRFTRAYCTQSVCTPSRAGLLTGRWSQDVGLGGPALWWNSTHGLDTQYATMSSVLSQAGYQTAMFGKWHLGALPKYMPNAHGFQYYEGIPYSNSMWHLRNDGSNAKFPPLPYYKDTQIVDYIDSFDKMDNLTQRLTQGALDYISTHANDSSPFFLYLAHPQPHVPLACSTRFKGKNPVGGLYADVLSELDASTGEILQHLEKMKIDDNTMVIFTSDNGPWLNYGNHSGRADGLREGKGTCFEGGFRVPLILRYPHRIRSNTVSDSMIAHLDLFPTLMRFANVNQKFAKLNGFDFSDYLLDQTQQTPRSTFKYYGGNGRALQAEVNNDIKEVYPHSTRSYTQGQPRNDGMAGTTKDVKISRSRFNLTLDPAETKNILDTSVVQ